jgi:pimeloyl-ACP methyl ester carboxylesterase
MIHGFNSDTGWMLKTVSPFLQDEVLPYDYILTWDYETLGTTSKRTGEDLAIALKQQCGFGSDDGLTLHIYAHSMGSIVSRTMIEMYGGHEFVDRLVIAGPPNQGTTLATLGRGSVYLLTLLLNQYEAVPPVGLLNLGLKQMYEASVGPADLVKDSDLLRRLNALEKPDNVPYLVLAGTNVQEEAERNRLNRIAHKILDTSLDTLFGEDHDLVIGLSSLRGVRGETYPNLTIKELPCNHFDYYSLPQARQIIKEWINS